MPRVKDPASSHVCSGEHTAALHAGLRSIDVSPGKRGWATAGWATACWLVSVEAATT